MIIFLTIKKIDINKINFKIIRPPIMYICLLIKNACLRFWYNHSTLLSIKCQQENYDKNRQTIILVIIPTKSAIKAAHNTNLVFFIPTELV